MPNKGPPLFVSDLKRTALPPPPPPTPQGRRQVLRVGGKGANYGWGFRPARRQAGGGGGGLIMVGGLVRRYDSEGGGRCTLQAQYERQGGEGIA